MTASAKISVVVVAVIIIGAVAMSFDVPGGPSQEMEGVVKGTATDPRDTGPPVQFATVALGTAGDVRAVVSADISVHSGEVVRVREYRRIITGAKTYEVVAAVKDAK